MRPTPCKVAGPFQRRTARELARLHAIQTEACKLVIARGYDGFTMEELAEAVGVSRRTLFNYVPDKASAVLGPFDRDDFALLDDFEAGGPTGHLLPDLVATIDRVIENGEALEVHDAKDHLLAQQAIASDPKVMALVTQRFTAITELLEESVCRRENWPAGDLRSRTLAATFLGFIKLALDELGKNDTASPSEFLDILHRIIDADTAVRSVS